jgi:hypothetical protein
LLLKV